MTVRVTLYDRRSGEKKLERVVEDARSTCAALAAVLLWNVPEEVWESLHEVSASAVCVGEGIGVPGVEEPRS